MKVLNYLEQVKISKFIALASAESRYELRSLIPETNKLKQNSSS